MNLFIHGRLGHFLMSDAPADGAPSGAAEPVPTPAAEPQTRHSVGALNSFADNQVPTVFEFDTEHRLGTGDVIYDTATIQAAINGTSGALSLGEFGTSFTVSRLTGRSNLDLQGRGTRAHRKRNARYKGHFRRHSGDRCRRHHRNRHAWQCRRLHRYFDRGQQR